MPKIISAIVVYRCKMKNTPAEACATNRFFRDLAFRPPAGEALFKLLGGSAEDDAGERDDEDADEQGVGGKGLSAIGDHKTDALAAAKHLADHDADEAQGHALPHARQDERHGAGYGYGRENLAIGGAEGACG